ncbi:MAG: hypothetical protein KGY80_12705 [Candidatus Thorarchaeota archaeon]|nr:hypothetical protein [Candidatus Thorarchaeota archaeon]
MRFKRSDGLPMLIIAISGCLISGARVLVKGKHETGARGISLLRPMPYRIIYILRIIDL